MKKFLVIISVVLLIIVNQGCGSENKPARGPEDEIYVIADSAEFEELRTTLETTFEKEIYTPQPEKLFILKRINVNQVNSFKNRKNIVIVAPLNSGSKTSEYISAIVDTTVEQQLRSDGDLVVKKYDLWAKGQLVTILSAPSMQELEFKILKNKDNILYSYQKKSDQRLFESLYNSRYEKKDIEGKFLRDYGWIIYVQADFQLALNVPQSNFVWLRRSPGSDMERWIFVHWIENATPEYLNADSIRVIRNKVTKDFYRTSDDSSYVIISDDYFSTSEVNFNGRYAILTQGLWDLNIKGMGGPFINYTFYDEDTRRIYMLDGSVFAPKYYKRTLIQQMDVTLQSFLTGKEISKERAEDLLNSIE